jgi:hypothetical protein
VSGQLVLRGEHGEGWSRTLWASLDGAGDLHVDGQDLGKGTEMVSSDGEYEWFQTIRAAHLPKLIELLGAAPGADLMTVLAERCTGDGSYRLEAVLRSGEFPVERHVYS